MAYELATPAIQAALIARLEADAALAALIKTRPAARGGGPAIYEDGDVYDGQTMPYLTIGLWTQTADHLFSNWGWTCTCQIKAISQKIDKPAQVTSAVLTALEHGTRLELPGYDSAWIDEISAQPMFRAQQGGKSTFELPIIVRVNVSEATAPPIVVIPPSPLLDDLVSYWSFDADWNDLHGTNHLTNHGVTSVAGKLGNAGDFEASSSQYLSFVEASPLLGSEDWTYAVWFKLEVLGSRMGVFGRDNTGNHGYTLEIGPGGPLWFYLADGGDANLSTAPLVTNTDWHFLLAWHDVTAKTLNLQLDDATVLSDAYGGIFSGDPTGLAVRLGSALAGVSYFDGLIDEVALWRRVLTADERTQLYNSGNGLAYPFNE